MIYYNLDKCLQFISHYEPFKLHVDTRKLKFHQEHNTQLITYELHGCH